MFDWAVSFASPYVEERFYQSSRMICIATHSMPFLDGILLHCALDKLNVPEPIIYARGLWGLGPRWCKEIGNGGGFINREILLLRDESTFCRAMFPSGGKIVWRSGYYVLAKELDADIVIIGIDYRRKEVVIDSIITGVNGTFEETTDEAMRRLTKYAPGPLAVPLKWLFGYG